MKANFASALLRKVPASCLGSLVLVLGLPVNFEGGKEAGEPEHRQLPSLHHWLNSIRFLSLYSPPGIPVSEDPATGARSAVFLEGQAVSGLPPLLRVDGPCLILLQWVDSDRIHLSVSDPELDLAPQPGQARNLTLTLEGAWRMERATAGVHLDPAGTETTLTFILRHGQSFNVGLERMTDEGNDDRQPGG